MDRGLRRRLHALTAVTLRPAGADDLAVLERMLVAAVNWDPGRAALSPEAVLTTPELSHYVAGWPRAGDGGVVAEAEGEPVGAAWYRLLPADDPGFGFVDAQTPEVSIAVVDGWRGQGVGGRLLEALVLAADRAGVTAVSLSVEVANPAARLYRRLGFAEVARSQGSVTMRRYTPSSVSNPTPHSRSRSPEE